MRHPVLVTAVLGMSSAACVDPPTHVLITLEDPQGFADGAQSVAVGDDSGVFRRIGDGVTFPVTFTVTSSGTEREELWSFQALNSQNDPIAENRARIVFVDGETTPYIVPLGAACDSAQSTGRSCFLPDGSGNEGECVASTCLPLRCGDGKVDDDEQCDDGNRLPDDGCTPECRFNVCGDGFAHATLEECDDGNDANNDACVILCDGDDCQCFDNVCGDGFVNETPTGSGPVEECDDGNLNESDECLNTCRLNVCGDGVVLIGVEACDDGNDDANDGCDQCEITRWSASFEFGLPPLGERFAPSGGSAGSSRLERPTAMTWLPPNQLAIVEHDGEQIFTLDLDGGRLIPLTSRGTLSSGDGGPAAQATFERVSAVASFASGDLVIADQDAHRVRLIDAGGSTISTLLGSGLAADPSGNSGSNVMNAPEGVTFAPNGDVYFSDTGNDLVRRISPRTGLSDVVTGFRPGSGREMVVSAEQLFVADAAEGEVDVVNLTTLSTREISGFIAPTSISAAPDGTVYVVDDNQLFSIDPVTSAVNRFAGDGTGFSPDGTAALDAALGNLVAVASGDDGTIYLLERDHGLVRTIDANGILGTAFGGDRDIPVEGLRAEAIEFERLAGAAAGVDGELYVADAGAGIVYRIDADGSATVVAGRGPGVTPPGRGNGGPAADAELDEPVRVFFDTAEGLYIAEAGANAVRRVDDDGNISQINVGGLSDLRDVIVDGSGDLLIADGASLRRFNGSTQTLDNASGDRIEQLQLVNGTLYYLDVALNGDSVQSGALRRRTGSNYETVETLFTVPAIASYAVDSQGDVSYVTAAGALFRFDPDGQDAEENPNPAGRGDGFSVADAELRDPTEPSTGHMLFVGDDLLIADYGLETGGVYRRVRDGIITTAIGRPNPGDGGFEYASLERPTSLVALADSGWLIGDRSRVRNVQTDTLRTVLGYPEGVELGSSPVPAEFSELLAGVDGLAVDPSTGHVFVSDHDRGRIVLLEPLEGDRDGWSAIQWLTGLSGPSGLALLGSPVNALLVADDVDHRIHQIELDTMEVRVLAGSVAGFRDSEQGPSARFNRPRDVAVDQGGSIFVADSFNHRIRRIDCTGEICAVTTVLGDSIPGPLVSGAPSRALRISDPQSLSVDDSGNLLVTSAGGLGFVLAGENGVVDGSDSVLQIFESGADSVRAQCLSAASLNPSGSTIALLDRCQGAFIRLQRGPR
ncbi:MAG: DUF4215 domain-containing protein [Myxococcota bacterium]